MDAGNFDIWSIRDQGASSGLIVFGNCIAQETEAFGMCGELVVRLTNACAAAEQGGCECKKEDFFHYWWIWVDRISAFQRTLVTSQEYFFQAIQISKAEIASSNKIRHADTGIHFQSAKSAWKSRAIPAMAR